ncbi:MAG: hypothetical protein OCD01_09155 [Fibrobacterales bacterium]
MKKKIIGAILATIIIGGVAFYVTCGRCHSKSQGAFCPKDSTTTEQTAHNHETSGLTLNDDQKWEMDIHTRNVLEKMQTTYNDGYKKASDESTFKALGLEQQVYIKELIAGCTMKGPAHDMLHTYLTKLMPAIDALATSGAKEKAKEVQLHLSLYSAYFK